jgi:hypothetical protein
MMKNRAPDVGLPAQLQTSQRCSRVPATRIDTVLFELSVEGGHGNGTSGKIYGSVDRDSTDDLPIIG